MKPGSELSSIFHKLWTKAIGGERYEKADWLALEKAIEALESYAKLFEDTIDLAEAEARVADSCGRDQGAAMVLASIVAERGVGWQGEPTARQRARVVLGDPRAGASDHVLEKSIEAWTPPAPVPGPAAEETLREGLASAVAAIDRDRSGMAKALSSIQAEVRGRLWITEGRGPYAWDDERYKEEAGAALRTVLVLASDALLASGRLADVERIIASGEEILKLPSRPELPLYDSDLDAMRALVTERDGAPAECLCAEIQRADRTRHFKGCPLRVEKEEKNP